MFSQQNQTQIIIFIIGLSLAIGLGILIAQFLKGSVSIALQRTRLRAGELLRGRIHLKAKKRIEANGLVVSLVCEQVIKERIRGKPRTHREEIFRQDAALENTKIFEKGFERTYDFEFTIPKDLYFNFTPERGMFSLFPSTNRLDWQIKSRLDAEGLDLTATKSIEVLP